MKVVWTEKASADILSIHEYIAAQSESYADSVYEQIRDRPLQCLAYPESGSVVREFGDSTIREVFVYSFRIIYKITSAEIRVLAVIHGSRFLDGGDLAPGERM
jgi:plasmid stabilization system protein ParE